MKIRAQAPGKVNLFLAVGVVDEDGYHELSTVFQAMDTYEEVSLTTRSGRVDASDSALVSGVSVTGRDADEVPTDGTNLAVKAVYAMAEYLHEEYGVQDFPMVSLEVKKSIPVAGGMAGGSADAAAALVGAAGVFTAGTDIDLSQQELLALGAGLGADVPFCILGGTAVGTGRGDVLEPIELPDTARKMWWVLAVTTRGLSTSEVFAHLDAMRAGSDEELGKGVLPEGLFRALEAEDMAVLGKILHNDLQAPALQLLPNLAEVVSLGEQLVAEGSASGVLVSGSGPTVAIMSADEDSAKKISQRLTDSGVCDDVFVTAAPGHGAIVVES